MVSKKFSESEEGIQLKNRIESWRQNRTSKKMPEDFWVEAVAQADHYSPSSVADFLKISYAQLIKRSPKYAYRQNSQVKKSMVHGFIELPPVQEAQTVQRIEVHLMNNSGQSATIHHGGSPSDWENFFTGWFKASRSIEKGCSL